MKPVYSCCLALSLACGGQLYCQNNSTTLDSALTTSHSAAVSTDFAPAGYAVPVQLHTSDKYLLKEGESVSLRLAQSLSSKTAAEGDPVSLILDDDLKVDGVTVAKSGCMASGEVTSVEKAGLMGKSGALSLRLAYLRVGDVKVKLRGAKGREGASGTASVVVLTVLFGPIGLIKHGKNAVMREGSPLQAFVADDIALVPAT